MTKRFQTVRGAAASRSWLVASLCLGLTGCNEEEHKKQLAELQAQAENKLAAVETRAKEKVATLEKELEAMKAEAAAVAAKAKAEAEEAASKAQASVEDAEKETAKVLDKARSAYKSEAKARYQALNNDLAEVTTKAHKIPAKSKAAYDKTIQTIVALQKDITKDIAAYDEATLDTFGKCKSKLDIDLAKYKANIKVAKAKLPKD
jgi:thiamine biosynthesis lipoprotein ApbE